MPPALPWQEAVQVVGKTLGHYEILDSLGVGGMGEVYRARDMKLDRDVAIKVLPEDFATDQGRLARFEREAKLLASLNHSNIAAIYGLEDFEGRRFIAMELVEGETLADRLANGALPLEQALRHGVQIGKALHEAHRAGIVHRDLKPGNIMLARQGIKLMDFGLAKATAPFATANDDKASAALTAAHPLTEMGTLIGTVPYMSPEQLEGAEVDVRADIFACGSVLYEMITGLRAFPGTSPAGVIAAILTAEPPPVSASQAAAPPFLDHLVLKCLAKDPDERWQSARDLAVELEWLEESSLSEVPRTIAPEAPGERAIDSGEQPGWQLSPRRDYQIAYFKSSDGTSIAAARGGSGTPLFVVPSMVDTIETSWAILAETFEGFDLITYDRRGTGLSKRGAARDAADSYLKDAQAVVDGFGLENFDVLGALLGTIEAAWVAAQNPDRVKRLVLRAPTLGLTDWASIPGVAAALAALEHDWEYFTESFGQFVAGWGDPNGPRLAARFRAITSREELRALLDALMKLDLMATYDDIRVPTLVEHHSEYFFPDTYSQQVASRIRDCRMAIFSGADGEFIADLSIAREFLRAE